MPTETDVEKKRIAHGFLSLHCPDTLIERLYNMGREASVSFRIESVNNTITTIWLENLVTGRVLDVEVGDRDERIEPFMQELLDTVIEVGEDNGRPWRSRKDAS